MKQLQLYTAPAAELFVIRFEQNLMTSTNEAVSAKTDWDYVDDWS